MLVLFIGMGGEKRNIRPVIFKFGVAIALSLGGVLCAILKSKRNNKPKPPQSGGGKSAAKRDHHAQTTSDEYDELSKVSKDSIMAAIPPNIRCGCDNDKFLLPEFHELVKEFDKNEADPPRADATSPMAFKYADRGKYEREINNLTNLVRVLREREGTLEIQLLEYCGLKEQETVVMELRNRLKLNNMETKIFSLKIESLQADNRRLEAQLSDYAKVMTELEAARGKIKLLKKKLKFETEQNKEHIMTLQQRVQLLQDKESQVVVAIGQDAIAKLQQVKDLEDELGELRTSNHDLHVENSELAQKLEYTRLLANSVLDEQESLKSENSKLQQQQNKDLTNQIEQLQADRCADVEELVYLRWINACLRYELKNYPAAPGNTTAKDLSKTISPKSEAKAKRLIMEYANREGLSEKGIGNIDSDLDGWSPSCSNITESGDFGYSPIDNSSSSKTDSTNKAKFLSKLKRLLTGKDSNHGHQKRHGRSSSMDNITYPSTPRDRCVSSSQASCRSSVDLGKLRCARSADMQDSEVFSRNSDVGPSKFSTTNSNIGCSLEENQQSESHMNAKNSELMKYAKVLQDSLKENSNSHGNSESCHSF